MEKWLQKADDQLGRTIKVDSTTLATTQGRFSHVCFDIDFRKPFRSRYQMRGREWQLRYEGLYDICFSCGKWS